LSRFFIKEQNSVTEYNDNRVHLMADCETLKKQINDWNDISSRDWHTYKEQCEALLEEEMQLFVNASKVIFKKKQSKNIFLNVSETDIWTGTNRVL
jgi:shikimate kinase